jgi:hypothetical protein
VTANCKHGAALFIFINEERSEGCTDSQKKWKAPGKRVKNLYPKGEQITSLFPKRQPPSALAFPCPSETFTKENIERAKLHSSLVHLCYKAKENPVKIPEEIPNEAIHVSPDVLKIFDGVNFLPSNQTSSIGEVSATMFFKSHIECGTTQAQEIFRKTLKQSLSNSKVNALFPHEVQFYTYCFSGLVYFS